MYDIEFRLKDPNAEPIIFWSVTHAQYINAAGDITEISFADMDDYDFMANKSGSYKFYLSDGSRTVIEISKDFASSDNHHLVFNPYYSIFVI